jgi:hypothetical protein
MGRECAAGQSRTVGSSAELGELLVAEIEPDGAAPIDRLTGTTAGRMGTQMWLPVMGGVRHACLALPGDERLRQLSFFAIPSTGFPICLPPMIVIVPCGPRPVHP